MTLTNIYVARHGYRANWLPPPHPPNPTGVDSDPPLAEHGVAQAKELAAYLAAQPVRPQLILLSPFYRCVQTAEPIAEALDVPIVLERGVGEWYKRGRLVVPEPANYELLAQFFPRLQGSLWARDCLAVIPSLQGELEEEIFERCARFWPAFLRTFEQKFPHIDTVLIVTHAATKIALAMSLLGHSSVHDVLADGTRIRAGACLLDRFRRGADTWVLEMNGNCDFLQKGEEMHWNFQSGFEAGSDEDIRARAEEAKAEAAAEAARGDKPDMEVSKM